MLKDSDTIGHIFTQMRVPGKSRSNHRSAAVDRILVLSGHFTGPQIVTQPKTNGLGLRNKGVSAMPRAVKVKASAVPQRRVQET